MMRITHRDLLQYMQKLDYAIDENGMCFGFAHMGMQAILAGDLETYNRRLNTLSKIPLDDLPRAITKVRNKIKGLKHTDEVKLSPEEQDILSIPAFFEGVVLYFSPEEYSDLFEEKTRPCTPNAELTFPCVLSKQLMIEEKDQKQHAIERINVEKVGHFSGVYCLQELEEYFTSLQKTLLAFQYNQPVSFVLESQIHSVAIGYDPRTRQWQWIDASQSKTIPNNQKMAQTVMHAFSKNDGVTILSTAIYVKKTDKMNIERCLADLKAQETWRKIHDITYKKSRQVDSTDASWLYIAAQHGHLETVKSLLKANANPNQADNNGATPLYIAVQEGHLEVVNVLLETGADPNQAITDGTTPLYIAAQHGNLEIITLLLKAGADPNQADNDGATPLDIAIQEGHLEVVKLLRETGADPQQAKKNSVTP